MEDQRVVRKHNSDYLRSGPASYASAGRRWGFASSLPGHRLDQPEAKHGTFLGQGGNTETVSDIDFQNDTHYTCSVLLGTPAQSLHLDFDVTKAESQVTTDIFSDIAKSVPATLDVAAFHPSKSTTFSPDVDTARGTDRLQINDIVLRDFHFKLKSAHDQEPGYHGMGSLGLAPGSPVAIKCGVFTAKFGNWRDPNDPEKKVSFFTLGFIHQPTLARVLTPIRYSPLCGDGWMFQSPTAMIGDVRIERPIGNAAIIDTVGPLALVDDRLLRALYGSIPGSYYDPDARGYLFPAEIPTTSLPVVRLAVGGHRLRIHEEALGFCNHRSRPGYLYGGFQSRGDLEFDVWGDTFLQGVYAVFDAKNQQFGAAELPDRTQPR